MPLTVMLRSAATNVAPDKHIHVVLIDGGISRNSRSKLELSLEHLPISIHYLTPDHSLIDDLMISHHATHSVYFRLLAGMLLPDSLDRIIYLDADMLVNGDLNELWEYPLGDDYCLAVPDIACPFICAEHADSNYKNSAKYLVTNVTVKNWQSLNLDPSAQYFNSGVMVLNLRRWQDECIEQSLLACLRDNEQFVWCWDQYALNVVFAGKWSVLPARWNQGTHVFYYPSPEFSPIPEDDFIEMRDNPAIIHYTTQCKPWHYGNTHPLRNLFFATMDETAFGGWRPQKPPTSLLTVLNTHRQRIGRLIRSPKKFTLRNFRRIVKFSKLVVSKAT
ncbi:MAG: glycosyltransferase family 8 protein, partial [Halioglobus sp.]|nr:glycosyltransferase family 8 protein [Halioglobus sp.]